MMFHRGKLCNIMSINKDEITNKKRSKKVISTSWETSAMLVQIIIWYYKINIMKKIIPFVLLELYRTSVSQKVPYFLILHNFPRWNIKIREGR
jgi:hypothetical protein